MKVVLQNLTKIFPPRNKKAGGEVVAVGTPEEVAQVEGSYTGAYLKRSL